MKEFLNILHVRRLLVFWFLMYIVMFFVSFGILALAATGQTNLASFIGIISGPFLYLTFAWLHFRKIPYNDIVQRFSTGCIWVVLTLIGTAIELELLLGVDWQVGITLRVLQIQAVNIAAVVVAGYLAHKEKHLVNIPDTVLKKMKKRGY